MISIKGAYMYSNNFCLITRNTKQKFKFKPVSWDFNETMDNAEKPIHLFPLFE